MKAAVPSWWMLGALLPGFLLSLGVGGCGRSVPLRCQQSGDCPKDERCSPFGACMPRGAECATDRECGLHFRCEQFACIPLDACRNDSECEHPARCLRDQPTDLHGRCKRPRDCQGPCPAHHYCAADLRCVPNGHCGSDADCDRAQLCRLGRCMPALCEDSKDCVAPRRCERDGVCRAPLLCSFDQDCPAQFVCIDKLCSFADEDDCETCQAPALCIQQRCVGPD